MNAGSKLNLLNSYLEKTGKSIEDIGVDAINIGEPFEKCNDLTEVDNDSDSSRENTVGNFGPHIFEFEPKFDESMEVCSLDEIASDIDDCFKPISFSSRVDREESNTSDLYEKIKSAINGIECSMGLDVAYKQFDAILGRLSKCNNGMLTNNQLVILISSMIVKLEELNSYNYPEINLSPVKNKLNDETESIASKNDIREYFFESFYKYYQEVEISQFNNLKYKYRNSISEFSSFQQGKSKMLMTLLKWLMS